MYIMETGTKKVGKAQVYNLIILDRSGSMECIRRSAVNGFNETLAGIKKAQETFHETQEHFVSLITFCGCSNLAVYDKVPAGEALPLRLEDYQPCCSTPLFDAMGFALTSMRKHVKDIEDSVVVVTVITDGEENSSTEYRGDSIRKLVAELQHEGWTFTYMGANQDSIEVAINLSIKNARNFAYDDEGMAEAYRKDTRTRMNFFSRLNKFKLDEEVCCCAMPSSARYEIYADMADEAFDEEEKIIE